MKKVLLTAIVLVSLASCKKDFVCECVETDSDGDTYTTEVTILETTKRDVKNIDECISYESKEVYSDGTTYINKVECEIEKK